MLCDTLPQQFNRMATPTVTLVEDNTRHCPGHGTSTARRQRPGWTTCGPVLHSRAVALRPETQPAPSRQAFAGLHGRGCSLVMVMWKKIQELEVLRFMKDTDNSPRSPLRVWRKACLHLAPLRLEGAPTTLATGTQRRESKVASFSSASLIM